MITLNKVSIVLITLGFILMGSVSADVKQTTVSITFTEAPMGIGLKENKDDIELSTTSKVYVKSQNEQDQNREVEVNTGKVSYEEIEDNRYVMKEDKFSIQLNDNYQLLTEKRGKYTISKIPMDYLIVRGP